eukprot:14859913-Alexandrium_andersonii.AAC.1
MAICDAHVAGNAGVRCTCCVVSMVAARQWQLCKTHAAVQCYAVEWWRVALCHATNSQHQTNRVGCTALVCIALVCVAVVCAALVCVAVVCVAL